MTRLDAEFEWRGRTVAWKGAGSGPPVVFCHGTPWSSVLWAPFADALSAEFSVYLWDMPGYGRSSKDEKHAVDLGTQGELFRDLIEYWGLDSPHVVAHDFGGAVSLRTHLLHNVSYASLALVGVVALRPWGSDFFRLVAEHPSVFARPTASRSPRCRGGLHRRCQPPRAHRGAAGRPDRSVAVARGARGVLPSDRRCR